MLVCIQFLQDAFENVKRTQLREAFISESGRYSAVGLLLSEQFAGEKFIFWFEPEQWLRQMLDNGDNHADRQRCGCGVAKRNLVDDWSLKLKENLQAYYWYETCYI